ncbi:MAG: hypothetical protein ABUR63_08980 [Verrucomicrobiota bacterium]
MTQKPQSQSLSPVHGSGVQPWLTGALGAVHRVFTAHVHPSLQGAGSHPCTSAAGLPTAHR